MFTGLIETQGRIVEVEMGSGGGHFIIQAPYFKDQLKVGDSVATNGVCLTVTEVAADRYKTQVMPASLASSNLRYLKQGDWVNLERALRADSRFDGHLVTGHVDTMGTVTQLKQSGIAKICEIDLGDASNLFIEKGSLALEGVSLTIQSLSQKAVIISLIPETIQATTLRHLRVGQKVNIESDVIGKYVQAILAQTPYLSKGQPTQNTSKIDTAYLKEYGYL